MPRAVVALLLALVAASAPAAERTHAIVPEDFFSQAIVTGLALAPDGGRVAYAQAVWGEADAPRATDLWVVDAATAERRRLTFDGAGAGNPTWSADGELVYFLAKARRAGEEKPPHDGSSQVWRVPARGGEPLAVTRVEGGVELFDLVGDTLVYVVGHEVVSGDWQALVEEFPDLEVGQGREELSELWALDLESWRERRVLAAERVIRALAASPDGRRAALVTTPEAELVSHEGWSRLDLVDLESGTVEVVTGPGWRRDHPSPYGWLEGLAWSADGGRLFFAVDFDGYPSELHVAALHGSGPGTTVARLERPDQVSVVGSSVACSGAAGTVLVIAEQRARARVMAVDPAAADGRGSWLLTPGEVVVEALATARGTDAVAVTMATATSPADVYLVAPGAEPRRLTRLNPQVDTWQLPQVELVRWAAPDGVEVEGVLELPPTWRPGDPPLPMVVEIHGGPSSATRVALEVSMYGRGVLPAAGYALLSPNYRGSTGYGDRFMTDLVGRENQVEVADILAGVDAMVARGVADPDRLGLVGWSNGGFLVNCLIAASDRFRAASSGAGVLDQVIQWGTEDTPGHVVNFMRGLPWQVPDAYRLASPVFALGGVRTPTLVHVGGDDPRVPPAHSRALFRALHTYLEVPAQLVVYPGEGHGLRLRRHRLAKMEWDLAWFGKYLAKE